MEWSPGVPRHVKPVALLPLSALGSPLRGCVVTPGKTVVLPVPSVLLPGLATEDGGVGVSLLASQLLPGRGGPELSVPRGG